MFHTPIDTRLGNPTSADRFFGFGEKPLQFPAAMDLCLNRAPATGSDDASRFAAATRKLSSSHAFRPVLTAADWRTFASFCISRRLPPDYRVLIPGCADRALRFVVEGSLWRASAESAASQPNLLLPGTVLGEDTLFSDAPGRLDVRTLEDSLILELSLPRQKELTAACPAIAFELLRAAGAVIAARGRTGERRDELATN